MTRTPKDPTLSTILAELRELKENLKAPPRRLLPIEETAAYLGLSPRTIRNDLSRGRFPVKPRRYGNKVLFAIEDLNAFVDSLGAAE